MTIMCVCSKFPKIDQSGFPTDEYELLVDYAFDMITGKIVPVQNVRPELLGAVFDPEYDEWIIY